MSNITFALDDDLLRQAKIAAAHLDTSLNAVVRILLAGFVGSVGEKGMATGNYRKLLDFSLGKSSYRSVMRDLNIDGDEALFVMMCGAGLPMPSLPEEETKKMIENMEKVLNG